MKGHTETYCMFSVTQYFDFHAQLGMQACVYLVYWPRSIGL